MKKITMMNKKVLIKKIENENKTSAGIILTKESDERFIKADVVCVPDDDLTVRETDIVLVDKYKLVEVKIEGATHICDLSDIVAIIEE